MTTPLDWRAHLTEEERIQMVHFDQEISAARRENAHYTAARELIRRRVTNRVKARMKREKK